jgi:hypothetical protein
MSALLPLKSGARAFKPLKIPLFFSLLAGKLRPETGFARLHPPPPSPPKPTPPSRHAQRPLLRLFRARGGLRFPVSARRYRLQVRFSGSVSAGKNPVPNSKRTGLRGYRAGLCEKVHLNLAYLASLEVNPRRPGAPRSCARLQNEIQKSHQNKSQGRLFRSEPTFISPR